MTDVQKPPTVFRPRPEITDEQLKRIRVAFKPLVGPAMRAGWRLVEEREDGAAFRRSRVNAILSAMVELDGRVWLHLSVSVSTDAQTFRQDRRGDLKLALERGVALPTWKTLVSVKESILGKQAKAILVIPPRSEHVNMAEVHHVWSCVDGDDLPDFTHGSGMI